MEDIHHAKRNLETRLETIETGKDSSLKNQENVRLIRNFIKYLNLMNKSHGTRYRYLCSLVAISNSLNKPFKEVTVKDIQDYISKVKESDLSEKTKQNYKVCTKVFFKWLKKTKNGYPKIVDWISTSLNKSYEAHGNYLTEEDVLKLIDQANNVRDIKEFLSIKIKDVEIKKQYVSVTIKNAKKSGSRTVQLVASKPFLAKWLNKHKHRDNPEAFLWIGLQVPNLDHLITYKSLKRVLYKAGRKAKCNKDLNPHSWRKARATDCARKGWTEFEMDKWFGWEFGSRMPAIYINRAGINLANRNLKDNGMLEEQHEESRLKPIACSVCKFVNEAGIKFCGECGSPLDVRTAVNLEEKRKKADATMEWVINEPEVREVIFKVIKRKNTEIPNE